MINLAHWRGGIRRARKAPLLAALLLSVIAHAVTLAGGWLQMPSKKTVTEPPPLQARLQTAPAVVPVPTTILSAVTVTAESELALELLPKIRLLAVKLTVPVPEVTRLTVFLSVTAPSASTFRFLPEANVMSVSRFTLSVPSSP